MNNNAEKQYELNKELAQMLKGGVIMDVTTPEQAKIAEEAGACAVMALERIHEDLGPCRLPGIPTCNGYRRDRMDTGCQQKLEELLRTYGHGV